MPMFPLKKPKLADIVRPGKLGGQHAAPLQIRVRAFAELILAGEGAVTTYTHQLRIGVLRTREVAYTVHSEEFARV
jgi:hypothetical protein